MSKGDLNRRAAEIYFSNLGMFADGLLVDDTVPDDFLSEIRMREACFTSLCRLSESPIEQIMAAILAFSSTGYDYPYTDEMRPRDFGAIIYPQCVLGSYRVDFCIKCHCGEFARFLIIECDGHDFHEKTKEQAKRDKKRDRDLSAMKATILRFTGSEIFRDPQSVMGEIEGILFEVMNEALADDGQINRGSSTISINPVEKK